MTLTFQLTAEDREFLALRRWSDDVVAQVIAAVSAETGIPSAMLKGPNRARSVSIPRQMVMALAHDKGASMPAIGRALGGRDHTTILHGIRAHKARNGQ